MAYRFTVEKLEHALLDLELFMAREQHTIEDWRFSEATPNFDPAAKEANTTNWQAATLGTIWGGVDKTYWFVAETTLPENWQNLGENLQPALVLQIGVGETSKEAEALLYFDGQPVHGLDINHIRLDLPLDLPKSKGQQPLRLAIKAWTGTGLPTYAENLTRAEIPNLQRVFTRTQLLLIDKPTENFCLWLRAGIESYRVADELQAAMLLRTMENAYNCIDFRQPGSEAFYASVAKASAKLESDLNGLKTQSNALVPTVTGIGHAHIDVAWLWQYKHTREKAARTFSTALWLMDEFPNYYFVQSQPQLYAWIKQDYPEIFERIQQKVKTGQWEPTGAMWVEADCNVSGGESLARQILYGSQFFEQEFGKTPNILWLPDAFGYSAALPELLYRADVKYFMTTKISWSEFNRPEYDTFSWQGPSGNAILGHFVTTPANYGQVYYTYNGLVTAESLRGIWENYRQKDINNEVLLTYGYGDGGGGPTREMLEAGPRLGGLPGLPLYQNGTATEFFARLDAKVAHAKHLPVWDGELYVETHRGTYTSQAAIKKANRKNEVLYHAAELFGSMASQLAGNAYLYPKAEMLEGWHTILRNQFHDVIPGSSVAGVYVDALAEHAAVAETGQATLDKALDTLAANISSNSAALVVFNPVSYLRSDYVAVPWHEEFVGSHFVDADNEALRSQQVFSNGQRSLLLEVNDAPACGYTTLNLKYGLPTTREAANTLNLSERKIETPFWIIELNEQGQISRLWDKKAEREVIANGQRANLLQVFEDRPTQYDAWNIDENFAEKEWPIEELIEAEVEETGPLRGVLRLTWQYQNSTVTQRLTVYANSPRIDFVTELDWQERQSLLKVAFPVEIRATMATYDIQFGNIQRSTHNNTSWDYARFEVPAQKWADISEGNYGVSLLNDCKYGYDVKGNTLRLTILKSAIWPDADADRGRHSFTYSLLPHPDNTIASTVEAAYNLNYPLYTRYIGSQNNGQLPSSSSFVSLAEQSLQSVIIETLKPAEDGNGLIVRLYEYGGQRGTLKLQFGSAISAASEVSLLERNPQPLKVQNARSVELYVKPYEIRTLRIES